MRAERELLDVFCGITDIRTMRRFFREIFTPAEIDVFVLRWRLLRMLKREMPQRRIAAELGVSLCKITRGSRVLKAPNSVTASILDERIGERDGSSRKTIPLTE